DPGPEAAGEGGEVHPRSERRHRGRAPQRGTLAAPLSGGRVTSRLGIRFATSHGCERSGIHSREASGGSGGCAASTPQLNKEEEACPRSTWPPNTPPLPSVPTRRA